MDEPSHRDSLLPTLAAALVGVQVGAATVASRFVIGETDPVMLGVMRYAIGVACLAPFVVRAGWPRFAGRDLAPMAVLGIVQFAVLIVLFNIALLHSPAARVALVFSAFPLLTMLFAAALGREALTLAKATGVVLTIAGVGLALGEKSFGGATSQVWIGDAAAFGAAICGALCSVLYRPYLTRYPALAVSAFAMLASVAALALLAAISGSLLAPSRLSAAGLAAVVFIGISSGGGFFALLWAYARTSPTRVAIFQPLAPVTAAVLGWLFLSETVSSTFLYGLTLVAAGIAVAHWPASPKPQ